MRVTNNLLVQRYMGNYYGNVNRLQKSQTEMTTGRRINKLSDDPVGLVTVLGTRSKIDELNQFDLNINYAYGVVSNTESSVSELNSVVVRMYELAVQAANTAVMTPDDLSAIRSEILQMRDHVVSTLNATFGEKNLFGGYNLVETPFTLETGETGDEILTYNGVDMFDLNGNVPFDFSDLATEFLRIEISANVWADVGVNGVEVAGLGDQNIVYVLNQFIKSINDTIDNGAPYHDVVIAPLQRLQSNGLVTLSEVGGKHNRMDYLMDRIGKDIIAYTEVKSRVQDIDQAQAIMNFKTAESAFKAALAAGPYVLQQNLLDFLR